MQVANRRTARHLLEWGRGKLQRPKCELQVRRTTSNVAASCDCVCHSAPSVSRTHCRHWAYWTNWTVVSQTGSWQNHFQLKSTCLFATKPLMMARSVTGWVGTVRSGERGGRRNHQESGRNNAKNWLAWHKRTRKAFPYDELSAQLGTTLTMIFYNWWFSFCAENLNSRNWTVERWQTKMFNNLAKFLEKQSEFSLVTYLKQAVIARPWTWNVLCKKFKY